MEASGIDPDTPKGEPGGPGPRGNLAGRELKLGLELCEPVLRCLFRTCQLGWGGGWLMTSAVAAVAGDLKTLADVKYGGSKGGEMPSLLGCDLASTCSPQCGPAGVEQDQHRGDETGFPTWSSLRRVLDLFFLDSRELLQPPLAPLRVRLFWDWWRNGAGSRVKGDGQAETRSLKLPLRTTGSTPNGRP